MYLVLIIFVTKNVHITLVLKLMWMNIRRKLQRKTTSTTSEHFTTELNFFWMHLVLNQYQMMIDHKLALVQM